MIEHRRQITTLVAVILTSSAALALIVILGFLSQSDSAARDRQTLSQVVENQRISLYNAARAECIRERGSRLDEARWSAVGRLISGETPAERERSGADLLALPNVFDLITEGGMIGDVHVPPCQPPVDSTTTTTKGT